MDCLGGVLKRNEYDDGSSCLIIRSGDCSRGVLVSCGVSPLKRDPMKDNSSRLTGSLERRAVGGVLTRCTGGSIRGSEIRVGVVGVIPGIRALLPGSCNWGSLCGDGVPSLSLGRLVVFGLLWCDTAMYKLGGTDYNVRSSVQDGVCVDRC